MWGNLVKSLNANILLYVALAGHTALSFSWPLKTDLKLGVGPSWNQIVGVDHYTINANGDQAKSTIIGLDNPLALMKGSLKFRFCDSFFSKLAVDGFIGRLGYFTMNNAEQQAPFGIQANLDGPLSTNIISISMTQGIDWKISDNFTLITALGYFRSQGNRFIKFINTDMSFGLKDLLNSGGFNIGGRIKASERITFETSYNFFIGPLSAKLITFPPEAVIKVFTPFFMFNEISLECYYHFNDHAAAFAICSWSSFQNIKRLTVKAPRSINKVISNQSISIFRSQFFNLLIGAEYKF